MLPPTMECDAVSSRGCVIAEIARVRTFVRVSGSDVSIQIALLMAAVTALLAPVFLRSIAVSPEHMQTKIVLLGRGVSTEGTSEGSFLTVPSTDVSDQARLPMRAVFTVRTLVRLRAGSVLREDVALEAGLPGRPVLALSAGERLHLGVTTLGMPGDIGLPQGHVVATSLRTPEQLVLIRVDVHDVPREGPGGGQLQFAVRTLVVLVCLGERSFFQDVIHPQDVHEIIIRDRLCSSEPRCTREDGGGRRCRGGDRGDRNS